MLRDGYVERAIKRLADGIARAVGLRASGESEQALAELRAAKAELPVVPGVFEVLSAKDLRSALGSDEVAAHYVELLRQEALVYYELGREREAERAQRRAQRLASELANTSDEDARPHADAT
jgi:hypothetical protein